MKPFSLISNMKRLLKPIEIKEFSAINGLKCICILQNIGGHRGYLEFGMPQANPNFMYWVSENIENAKC